MNHQPAALFALAVVVPFTFFAPLTAAEMTPPKAGKVEIMKASAVKPGMHAVAWTVFQGTQPEAVPIEIVGMWKNMWGPGQDIIVGKMGGKAKETNVAGGMSGSPVYVDGKLIGAVALRLSVFSPDAICGITPIELMLEINDIDKTRPMDSRAPGTAKKQSQAAAIVGVPNMVQIDTPLTFSGFNQSALTEFGPVLQELGISAVMGGAGGSLRGSKPAAGWQKSLNPGESVAGVLVSGDMDVTGLGTVTYNDGHRILAFGHPFFNLGPVDMPMSKGEVLMVLASSYQPNKMANATEIVGSLHQDRHSGIMGVLGDEAPMIPVSVKVRALGETGAVRGTKEFHFNVFQHQKWTPYLMTMTLYNALSGDNEFKDEATYRLSGQVDLDGQSSLALSTMQASGEMPVPAPMVLANWYGEKFSRLFLNSVDTPQLKGVNVTVDLLPERRIATIENGWVGVAEARPGETIPLKVFLRPYRGDRIERSFDIRLPVGLSKGEHRIMLSDAETMNRMQMMAGGTNRYIDIPQAVSLINQERTNSNLYVSLLEPNPTAYYNDKAMPSLPGSVLNVMQAGRASSRTIVTAPESATEQMAVPFDYVISGSYALKVLVR
jgi:SpoIVB peptidase S55